MFLIAKIVRGRRLLHELEQREKDQAAAAALEAAQSISQASNKNGCQVSRRLAARHQRSSRDMTDETEEGKSSQKADRRKSGRRKTHACGSVDLSLNSNDRLSVRRTSSMPSLFDIAPKPVSSSLKHYNYDDKLNRLQRRALRFTWHRLHTRNGGKRVENVFEEVKVYDRLVRVLPSVKDIFTTRMFLCAMSRNETASLRDHARVTVKMFDLALRSIDVEESKREDTGSPLDPKIIGRAHGLLRPYGLTGQHWEKLGEIIIDVVLAQEAVRDLPGAGQAWVIFTACLVDQLRAGFEESRAPNQMITKRNTVLHYATKHLYDSAIRLNFHFVRSHPSRKKPPEDVNVNKDQQESNSQNMNDTTILSSSAPSTSNDDDVNPEAKISQQSAAADVSAAYNIHCRRNVQQVKRKNTKVYSRNEDEESNELEVVTTVPSQQTTTSRRRQSNLPESPTSTTCVNRS